MRLKIYRMMKGETAAYILAPASGAGLLSILLLFTSSI